MDNHHSHWDCPICQEKDARIKALEYLLHLVDNNHSYRNNKISYCAFCHRPRNEHDTKCIIIQIREALKEEDSE